MAPTPATKSPQVEPAGQRSVRAWSRGRAPAPDGQSIDRRFLLAAGLALLGGCTGSPLLGPFDGGVQVIDPSTAREVVVVGDVDSTMGIFDPSLVYFLDAPSGLMSYSSVPSQLDVHTHLASSSDRGATWTFLAEVNAPSDVMVSFDGGDPDCPTGTCAGRVIHEVSSLVDDSLDPDHRYKIFAHTYVAFPEPGGDPPHLRPDVGYLSLYTAPATGGPWVETKLVGWQSPSSFSSTDTALLLGRDLPALGDCLALTEPAAILDGASLALAVTCAYLLQGKPAFRQELLRSYDHAQSFVRVGTLMTSGDAAALGSPGGVNAADLFSAGGLTFAIVSPGGQVSAPDLPSFSGYAGCDVLTVDLADASVLRDGTAPVLFRRLVAANDTFSGACTYAEGASSAGYLMSILGAAPRLFRIYATGLPAP